MEIRALLDQIMRMMTILCSTQHHSPTNWRAVVVVVVVSSVALVFPLLLLPIWVFVVVALRKAHDSEAQHRRFLELLILVVVSCSRSFVAVDGPGEQMMDIDDCLSMLNALSLLPHNLCDFPSVEQNDMVEHATADIAIYLIHFVLSFFLDRFHAIVLNPNKRVVIRVRFCLSV